MLRYKTTDVKIYQKFSFFWIFCAKKSTLWNEQKHLELSTEIKFSSDAQDKETKYKTHSLIYYTGSAAAKLNTLYKDLTWQLLRSK